MLTCMRVASRASLVAAVLVAVHLAPAEVIAAPQPLAVHVSANHLVDASGLPLVLHGYDISATEFACDQGSSAPYGWSVFGGPNDTSAVMEAMAAWHGNAVRVPLNEDCWLGINGVNPRYGGESYRSLIHSYVESMHRYGFYVIVDLHWSAPGSAPAQSQQPMPDADHSVAFWTSVASAFSSDPAVIFDLYNEPFIYASYLQDPSQNPWRCWLEGCGFSQYLTGNGKAYTAHQNWTAVGMQTLVNAVRATGATQPIMIAGLNWANDLSGWSSHFPYDPLGQLAASWHSYPGQQCSAPACWNAVIAPLAVLVPVVVGETGDSVCQAPTYDPTFLPWADTHGISYLGWTWNPWSNCSDVLVKNWSGTPSANYGQYFHDHLAALATQEAAPSSPPSITLPAVASGPSPSGPGRISPASGHPGGAGLLAAGRLAIADWQIAIALLILLGAAAVRWRGWRR